MVKKKTTNLKKGKCSRVKSPLEVEIPHLGHYLVIWQPFLCKANSFRFPQKYQVILLANLFKAYFKQCINFFGRRRHNHRLLTIGSSSLTRCLSCMLSFSNSEHQDPNYGYHSECHGDNYLRRRILGGSRQNNMVRH